MKRQNRGQLNRNSGFSLIELMVVLAIVGILAVIVVPSYNNAISSGKGTECSAYAYDLENKLTSFYFANQSYTNVVEGGAGCVGVACGLGEDDNLSGGEHCDAVITTTPAGCNPADRANRCTGYELRVRRTVIPTLGIKTPESTAQCGVLVIDQTGTRSVEKHPADPTGAAVGSVATCWK